MAVRSRSSLRFSMRRTEHGAGHHDDDALPSSPPAKRPRLQQQQKQQLHRRQTSSRRRKSSPDLLDTTIDNSSHSSSKTPLARHTLSPLPPPRSSTHRPSLSAVGDRATSSSSSSAHLPPVGTPRSTGQPNDPRRTPSASALYMRGEGRESPDPLDTISPAPSTTTKIPPPRKTPTTSTPTPKPRSTRRSSRPQPPAAPDADADADAEKSPARSRSRSSRKSTTTGNASESQSQSQSQPPEPRRSLRSKDSGSRLRSELASYFWNYEQLLSLEPPKTTELLTEDTLVNLIDDLTEPLAPPNPDSESPFGNPLLKLHDCEKVALPELGPEDDGVAEDPLNEGYYFRAHRRMERQEKQLRNIERDRAQHEKMQLERLLDELKSHDWLRVMGLTGITDREKKLYEPKRDYFIKEISSLIEKFQIWKEEEKRRKLGKRAEITPPSVPSKDRTTSQPQSRRRKRSSDAMEESTLNDADPGPSTDDPLDPSDVDARAAHQLQQEARSATARKRRRKSTPTPTPAPATAPDKPFTSFFAQPHLREAALSPHRDRVSMAFGHPIPELPEREFQPPADILTPEAIDACRRKRRRMKRGGRS